MSWENYGKWYIDHKIPLKYNKPSIERGCSTAVLHKYTTHAGKWKYFKMPSIYFWLCQRLIKMTGYIKKPHTAIFTGQTGCGKTHLVLKLIEKEYNEYFDFIVIICQTL